MRVRAFWDIDARYPNFTSAHATSRTHGSPGFSQQYDKDPPPQCLPPSASAEESCVYCCNAAAHVQIMIELLPPRLPEVSRTSRDAKREHLGTGRGAG